LYADRVPKRQPSRALSLAAAGLVKDVKVGRERMRAFEPAQLDQALRSLETIAQQWDHAPARLKAAVEI
jgi:hypothetical protein